ncbi:MAG: IPT/TIG domain-containing protein, partial [Verrucomicrobia bacterium]|nr:IPT/TIG domain-containing protein [Verrucomicrobiota bacterium]
MLQRYSLSFLLSLCFLFITSLSAAQPVITNISPATGPSSGGTTITITGSGFTGTTAVTFGTVPAASFAVSSDSSMSVTSPVHWPQVVNVTVTTLEGTSVANNRSFFTFQGNWQAYCTDSDGFVWAIDVPTNTVTTSIPIIFDSNSTALAITPDGSQVFIANN